MCFYVNKMKLFTKVLSLTIEYGKSSNVISSVFND